MPTQSFCTRCGHVSSQAVCKACVLLEGLNKGRPRLGVGKSSKVTRKMRENPASLVEEEERPVNGSTEIEINEPLSGNKVVSVADKCAPSSIEDIGSGNCGTGGTCCGGCDGKKTRKVISLKETPALLSSLVDNIDINKSHLDF